MPKGGGLNFGAKQLLWLNHKKACPLHSIIIGIDKGGHASRYSCNQD